MNEADNWMPTEQASKLLHVSASIIYEMKRRKMLLRGSIITCRPGNIWAHDLECSAVSQTLLEETVKRGGRHPAPTDDYRDIRTSKHEPYLKQSEQRESHRRQMPRVTRFRFRHALHPRHPRASSHEYHSNILVRWIFYSHRWRHTQQGGASMTRSVEFRWILPARKNPCPLCNRTKDNKCRRNGAFVMCLEGSSHHPPD